VAGKSVVTPALQCALHGAALLAGDERQRRMITTRVLAPPIWPSWSCLDSERLFYSARTLRRDGHVRDYRLVEASAADWSIGTSGTREEPNSHHRAVRTGPYGTFWILGPAAVEFTWDILLYRR
jgi:hypothetical protein